MALSKTEAKQLLERMIFDDQKPKDWVEDVWGITPILGDSAAKLYEAFEALVECCHVLDEQKQECNARHTKPLAV